MVWTLEKIRQWLQHLFSVELLNYFHIQAFEILHYKLTFFCQWWAPSTCFTLQMFSPLHKGLFSSCFSYQHCVDSHWSLSKRDGTWPRPPVQQRERMVECYPENLSLMVFGRTCCWWTCNDQRVAPSYLTLCIHSKEWLYNKARSTVKKIPILAQIHRSAFPVETVLCLLFRSEVVWNLLSSVVYFVFSYSIHREYLLFFSCLLLCWISKNSSSGSLF